jgi:AhpD family alkylhydroperoxidase
MKERMKYYAVAPEGLKNVLALEQYVQKKVEPMLLHLVKLRASQINGCAYCIDLHTREATRDGEKVLRLHMLSAWRESPIYSEKERAALDWTEELTLVAETGARDEVFERLKKHFSDEEIADLTFAICAINVWNRLRVGFRLQHRVD